MKPLREVGYVAVGMVLMDVNGMEAVVTGITIPTTRMKPLMSKLPNDTDLMLELNGEHFMRSTVSWTSISNRVLVKMNEQGVPIIRSN